MTVSGGIAGGGFAIPIDAAMRLVQQIRNGGNGDPDIQTGQRAMLGVTDNGQDATVQTVQPGTPAASAGIAPGDVITSLGGEQVTSGPSLMSAVLRHTPGDRVVVTWLDVRGRAHSVTVTLTSGPPA